MIMMHIDFVRMFIIVNQTSNDLSLSFASSLVYYTLCASSIAAQVSCVWCCRVSPMIRQPWLTEMFGLILFSLFFSPSLVLSFWFPNGTFNYCKCVCVCSCCHMACASLLFNEWKQAERKSESIRVKMCSNKLSHTHTHTHTPCRN